MKLLSKEDVSYLQSVGIDAETAENQIDALRGDAPVSAMVRTASLEDGIELFTKAEEDAYVEVWKDFIDKGRTITHFIPASGQAERFFKELYAFLKASRITPQTNFEKNFFKHITSFAFYNELNKVIIEKEKKEISDLMEVGKFKLIVEYLLTQKGLGCADFPHAVFKFHTDKSKTFASVVKYLPKQIVKYYSSWEDTRTPIQESLIESAMVSGKKGATVNVCYTVQEQDRDLLQDYVREVKVPIEKKLGVQFHINLPVQNHYTDTMSLDSNGVVIRNEDGNVELRPSGHGALFQNLNSLSADIVFIKNLDNESPDSLRKLTVKYKQMLGGILVANYKKIRRYLRALDKEEFTDDKLIEMINYVENTLNVKCGSILRLSRDKQIAYIKQKLNRPLRVCGMVKNEDEMGGVPCWVNNPDGTTSLQIVEFYQVYDNPELLKKFLACTHFNPVDIACYITDYKGKKFDLSKFTDKNNWMPYDKTMNDGSVVRRLDRQGLWNGCMADWNTIFVEVPIKTFNPVKTVNDLLRQEHQN